MTTTERVLVVDDEKNIRLTVSEALRAMELDVETAARGEEALARLAEEPFWLVLLDLRMPGMDGLEVLRRARKLRPETIFVLITAHGTVEDAVEAMKLGALDFLRKPFGPRQLRSLVQSVRERRRAAGASEESYDGLIERARRRISRRDLSAARSLVEQARVLDEARPEAYNLEGVLFELEGDRFQAQQCYRRALELDRTYEPARINLHHSVEPGRQGSFILQEAKKRR